MSHQLGNIERFENQVCEFTGSKYAVAVVSGTAALHLGLLVGGIKPNEEVLIPSSHSLRLQMLFLIVVRSLILWM